jgi:Arc/MetJ-type ribon-helix-helix transcriptional regulator
MSEEMVELTIKLPKPLVEWAQEYVLEMGGNVSDLVAATLRPAYEAWSRCERRYKLQLESLSNRLKEVKRKLDEALSEKA